MPIEKVYFWPQWLVTSLPPQTRQRLPINFINKLGRANICLWRALNIYDDFLDGAGQPAKLPLANLYYRRWLKIHYGLGLTKKFYQLLDQLTNDLDQANRQETLNRREIIDRTGLIKPQSYPQFSNFNDLARKSLPLSLGPIAILFQLNVDNQAARIQKTLNFFRSALAAKQLADDAQDWLDDLRHGLVTPANALILEAAAQRQITLDVKQDLETAYLLFANYAAPRLSAQLSQLCCQTKAAAAQIGLGPRSALVQGIIGPLENGLNETAKFKAYWLQDSQKML
jgi:hypothetical protein